MQSFSVLDLHISLIYFSFDANDPCQIRSLLLSFHFLNCMVCSDVKIMILVFSLHTVRMLVSFLRLSHRFCLTCVFDEYSDLQNHHQLNYNMNNQL